MNLDQLIDEFSPEVRSLGSAYHRGGVVEMLVHSADAIRARVKGTQSYDVQFQYTNKGVLLLACTCPYFLGRGPCKHLWATALTAAEQGMLAKIPLPTGIADAYREAETVNDSEANDIDRDGLRAIPNQGTRTWFGPTHRSSRCLKRVGSGCLISREDIRATRPRRPTR